MTARVARRAMVDDVAGLVRLRAVMFEAMDIPTGDVDAPWRAAAHDWFVRQLDRPASFAAYVVDVPGEGPVSMAVGICDERAPSPRAAAGVRGHVSSVVTQDAHRRRGYADACLRALLAWFSEETAADSVELVATREGAAVYAALGFTERRAMRLTLR